MHRARPLRIAGWVASLATSFVFVGCVERVLVVESHPPGARVFVDGTDRGATPVRVPYVHEGRFRVRLEMEGYDAVADEIVTRTGPDAVPGIDFFAENVWPGRIRRTTVRRYDLPPLKPSSYTEAEIEALLRRADGFRDRTQREVREPGTPSPSRPPSPTPAPAPRAPAGR